MDSIGSLDMLNDARENKQKMLAKLPDRLIVRWGKQVSVCKEVCGSYPSFLEDVDIVVGESDTYSAILLHPYRH